MDNLNISFAPDKSAEDKGRINAVEDYLSLLTERIKFCLNGIDENIAQKSDGEEEKQLIYSATGRKVPTGKLPADVGVVVNNVATCLAVCEAIELGKPDMDTILTVSGQSVARTANIKAPVGTPVSYIVEYCGGEKSAPKKVLLGGPMTGVAIKSYDLYVKKTTSGILLLSDKEAAAEEPTPCLNCGLCAEKCPRKIITMQR